MPYSDYPYRPQKIWPYSTPPSLLDQIVHGGGLVWQPPQAQPAPSLFPPNITGDRLLAIPVQQRAPAARAGLPAAIPFSASTLASPAAQNAQPDQDAHAANLAQSIDAYLRQKGSPMAGTGSDFVHRGQQRNLDPRYLVAVAGAESTFGKKITRGQYNALNDLYNGIGNDAPFPSWDRAINGAAISLDHARQQTGSDIQSIYERYCGKGGDCSNGVKNIYQFMKEQGADPNVLDYPHPPK